ncbi:hypothetical protein GIB67_016941 [Kingdonia uniflora]|uniref:Cytochrome P450 n=1 Tax=Kingdonia uniflora TaxID=39325 RepID=A0A7J7M3F0_9MAGN|nr:hypothetical protein GIB67_016941 [Kingdonia uniflora]
MDLFFFLQSLLFPLLFFFTLFIYIISFSKKGEHEDFNNYPLLGILPDLLKNGHRYLEWTTDVLARYPTQTVTTIRPINIRDVTTANPLNVEHLLKTNFENYPKGDRFISVLEDFLGKGIFNTDSHLWRFQRKTASFEFNTKSLRNFVIENVREEIQSRLIPLLLKNARDESNKRIDLQDLLERFAFDNVCKVTFNEDQACLAEDGKSGGDFMLAFEDAATISSERFLSGLPFLWKIKRFFNIGSEKRLKEAISIVHGFADKVIRARLDEKVQNVENADLLSRFIANDENSPEFLRDIIISFILAGRDTTSSALSWFFWILSSRPDVEKNILDELKAIRERNGKRMGDVYNLDELREMHYLHASIFEAMRLYPPVACNIKACLKDDVLPDGTFVGKGWIVNYNLYSMGRMESIWGEDCREFVPDRWLENGMFRPENPSRYPVFHAGPRMCLGKEMAHIQMKSIAASVIERFEMDVLDKETRPQYTLSLTLRMKHGLMVKMRERSLQT